MGHFSIWPVGPDGLRVTCTYVTFLHLHPTSRTRRLACHVYLWDLSPSPSDLWDPMACVSLVDPSPSDLWGPTTCVSLVDPSPSDLWVPMAYVSRVLVGHFSISIRPVGPDGLRVTCTLCATRVNKFKFKKKHETWESNLGPRARNGPSSPLR
jgi:hypothetical protein